MAPQPPFIYWIGGSGVRGTFFREGKVTFPDFFPGMKYAFSWWKLSMIVDSKQNSVVSTSDKQKTKQNKTKPSLPGGSVKISQWKMSGAICPPPTPPVTPLTGGLPHDQQSGVQILLLTLFFFLSFFFFFLFFFF